MKKWLLLFFLVLTVCAWAQVRSAPLVLMWKERTGYENIIWMEQRVKIGGDSVSGYMQGSGGADDAVVVYNFKDDWDMFTATVGFKDSTPENRKATFSVEAGGKELYNSGIIESKGASHQIRVPIRGHKTIVLRITPDRYNDTAGAAWGAPTVYSGLSAEQMRNDWSLSVNNRKTPLNGNSAPSEVPLMFDVPGAGAEVEYRVKIRRDSETRTVVVEKERVEP